MINSLNKDSHMTLNARLSENRHLKKSISQNSNKNSLQVYSTINLTKPANPAFGGFLNSSEEKILSLVKKAVRFVSKKFPSIDPYQGETMKKLYSMADTSEPIFNALFAIGLTCVLRPAAIMSLPGDKNKEDKIYASAHSISAGLIGYALSKLLLSPVTNACNKLKDTPDKFFSKDSYFMKLKNADVASTRYVKMISESAIAIPRAFLTVALIPPVLKYVFGWEKKTKEIKPEIKVDNQNTKTEQKQADKKAKEPEFSILENYAAINFQSADANSRPAFQSFMGGVK